MNTRIAALAALAAVAGIGPTDTFNFTPERVSRPHVPLSFAPVVHGGGRPTTPSKARQAKLKRRAKGRH